MKRSPDRQDEIRAWFDEKYAQKHCAYLRPKEAYALFPEILSVHPGAKLLDIACGPGLLMGQARKRGALTYGVDISGQAVRMCRASSSSLHAAVANAESLPFGDGVFDLISCIGSLERFLDLERVLSELIRVSKDRAAFCFMVRNARSFTWMLFMRLFRMQNLAGNQNARTFREWNSIFSDAGLRVVRTYHDHWPFLKFLRICTFKSSRIDYRKVRKSFIPLQYSGELIFQLTKKPGSEKSSFLSPGRQQ